MNCLTQQCKLKTKSKHDLTFSQCIKDCCCFFPTHQPASSPPCPDSKTSLMTTSLVTPGGEQQEGGQRGIDQHWEEAWD